MKNKKIILGVMLGSILFAAGCQNNVESSQLSSSTSNQIVNTSSNENNLSQYNFVVEAISGKKLENVAIEIYSGDRLVKSIMTDRNGQAIAKIENGNYIVKLENLASGYYYEKDYQLVENTFDYSFEVMSFIPNEEAEKGTTYALKDIMYDFTVKDSDGKVFNLQSALEDFDAVVINFWYTTCYWCGEEFPFMEESYQKYKNDIAIIALSTMDSINAIKNYKEDYGLSFSMSYDSYGLFSMFGFQGAPSTVVVDRYGIISFMEEGAIQSVEEFDQLFEQFIGDDYTPITKEDSSEDEENRLPNVSMPASEEIEKVINGEGFNASYTMDEDEENLEYAWPWLISEDYKSIYPANTKVDNTAATIETRVTIPEGKTFSFDYLSSTEKDYDVLFVIVDGLIVQQISGVEGAWKTCYAYVSNETKEYNISLCYLKDGDSFEGQDLVYINNLRLVDANEIDNPTYIYRYCSNGLIESSYNYQNYVETYYNENDGYYHVGNQNGPLVLAELIYATHWSPNFALLSLAAEGLCTINGEDYNELITTYASYASNGKNGYTPVTQELKEAMQKITTYYSENTNEFEWLELCGYYEAFGTNGQELEDPIKGLAPFSAYETNMGDQNFATFTKPIIPRGYKFRFEVSEAGVYKINTIGNKETVLWIYDSDDVEINESTLEARYMRLDEKYYINAEMYHYFEANTTYYIVPAFYDLYEVGTVQFNVEYVAEEMDLLTICSPLYYVSGVDENGNMTDEIFSGGINVVYNNEDGYYHELRSDGTIGSIIYADFEYANFLFNYTLNEMIRLGGFKLENEDLTMLARDISATRIQEEGDLYGTVPVTEEVKVLLEKLITYYHDGWVENNWLKLCYYYRHYGPIN